MNLLKTLESIIWTFILIVTILNIIYNLRDNTLDGIDIIACTATCLVICNIVRDY